LKYIQKVNFSEWGTPIVIVKKTVGKIRMCGDYKVTLNPMLAEVCTPLLNMEDLLTEIGNSTIFSKIDLEGAYLQLKLNDKSKKFTTINTPWGLFQYNRLPFGIKTAPGIFQTTMLKITNGLSGVLVYLDDILVYGESKKDHDEKLNKLLDRLKYHNVQLNRAKCVFGTNEIKFLGHVISQKGIQPNRDLIKDIINAPLPQTKQQLQSFIGSLQFYSKFIPNLADKLKPLTNLLRTEVKWNITDEVVEAIAKLKQILTGDLIIKPFTIEEKCQLLCDASPIGLGAVLQQKGHPVLFISRKLTKAEEKYSQTEREALAIVWAVKRLKNFY